MSQEYLRRAGEAESDISKLKDRPFAIIMSAQQTILDESRALPWFTFLGAASENLKYRYRATCQAITVFLIGWQCKT